MTRKQKNDQRKALRFAARKLVGDIMLEEYGDMLADKRPRTDERLEWLKNHAKEQAVRRFNYDKKAPPHILERFANSAEHFAGKFIEEIKEHDSSLSDKAAGLAKVLNVPEDALKDALKEVAETIKEAE